MTWHYLPELPKPNIEVLAEVQGKLISKYFIGMYSDGPEYEMMWYFHSLEFHTNDIEDVWVCNNTEPNQELYTIKRWAYIEDE